MNDRAQSPNYPTTQLPNSTSVVVPASTRAFDRRLVPTCGRPLTGTRSSSSTMDRRTAPASAPTAAGARVIRHPYNKGNGAAVKTGIRQATGTFILIIDADGQHRPADAAAAGRPTSTSTISSSARVRRARRPPRHGGSATRLLNWIASYLTERPIPDLTSGIQGGQTRVPRRVPAPAAQRLFHADHDDAGVREGRLQRAVRADRRGAAGGPVEDSPGRRRRELPADPAEGDHDLQPAPHLSADQRGGVRRRRGLRGLDDPDAVARHEFVGRR